VTFLLSAIPGRTVADRLTALPLRPGEAATGARPADTGLAAAGLPTTVTPPDQFYVVSKKLVDPVVDVTSWTMAIDGQVVYPLTLSYADILALPAVETYRTLPYISNEVGGDLIGNGQQANTPLGSLL
jgi:DMSO/TMAO reductase YedYZ molybdopterin-dependent catalytic subunit